MALQRGGVNTDFAVRLGRETEDPFQMMQDSDEDPANLDLLMDGDALLYGGTWDEIREGLVGRKVRSKSPYFCLFTDTMSFPFKKEVIIQDCTMVNVNTVMLAAQSFEVDDRSPEKVRFGGWQATLADPELRKMLRKMLDRAIFDNHQFQVGKEGAELLPLLEFMGRNIEVSNPKNNITNV